MNHIFSKMVNDLNQVSFSYDDVFFIFNFKVLYAFLWSLKPVNFGEILDHLPPLKKILVTPLLLIEYIVNTSFEDWDQD